MMKTIFRQSFNDLVNQPDEQIELLRAALVIAEDTYPGLNAEKYLLQIRQWAEDIQCHLPRKADVETKLQFLNSFLFGKLGFNGNFDDYYDPRNSYLNEVLERRQGIPITLAVIYIELGNRLGLDMLGVSFPGHFLVKLPYEGGEVVLDPFYGGISLSEQDLVFRLHSIFNADIDDVAPFLEAASNKDILLRILTNLKGIYIHRGDAEKSLEMINKILLLDPHRSHEYRERGLLLASLECYHTAIKDLQHYLNFDPQVEDIESLRELVISLQYRYSYLN